MKRTITEIIIHCSATPEGADIRADTIDKWHRRRGFNSIGYHYVIDLDGTIEPGRPLTKPGAHCQGHNKSSIGICYVGGTDANHHPADTRTPQQNDSLQSLITHLHNQYPNAAILGHNQLNPRKNCPSFSVPDWLTTLNIKQQ